MTCGYYLRKPSAYRGSPFLIQFRLFFTFSCRSEEFQSWNIGLCRVEKIYGARCSWLFDLDPRAKVEQTRQQQWSVTKHEYKNVSLRHYLEQEDPNKRLCFEKPISKREKCSGHPTHQDVFQISHQWTHQRRSVKIERLQELLVRIVLGKIPGLESDMTSNSEKRTIRPLLVKHQGPVGYGTRRVLPGSVNTPISLWHLTLIFFYYWSTSPDTGVGIPILWNSSH